MHRGVTMSAGPMSAAEKGKGGGRSLVLSGHIDTVPRGTQRGRAMPSGVRSTATVFMGALE